MLSIKIKNFEELTSLQIYDILQLRAEVFVVEQNCVYQDIDGKDNKAKHILMYKDTKLIGYARLFKPKDYFKNASIGRVIIKETERKKGYAHRLMKIGISTIKEAFDTSKITLSAQLYLQKFYESHGFKKVSEVYLEDGLPHIRMTME